MERLTPEREAEFREFPWAPGAAITLLSEIDALRSEQEIDHRAIRIQASQINSLIAERDALLEDRRQLATQIKAKMGNLRSYRHLVQGQAGHHEDCICAICERSSRKLDDLESALDAARKESK